MEDEWRHDIIQTLRNILNDEIIEMREEEPPDNSPFTYENVLFIVLPGLMAFDIIHRTNVFDRETQADMDLCFERCASILRDPLLYSETLSFVGDALISETYRGLLPFLESNRQFSERQKKNSIDEFNRFAEKISEETLTEYEITIERVKHFIQRNGVPVRLLRLPGPFPPSSLYDVHSYNWRVLFDPSEWVRVALPIGTNVPQTNQTVDDLSIYIYVLFKIVFPYGNVMTEEFLSVIDETLYNNTTRVETFMTALGMDTLPPGAVQRFVTDSIVNLCKFLSGDFPHEKVYRQGALVDNVPRDDMNLREKLQGTPLLRYFRVGASRFLDELCCTAIPYGLRLEFPGGRYYRSVKDKYNRTMTNPRKRKRV